MKMGSTIYKLRGNEVNGENRSIAQGHVRSLTWQSLDNFGEFGNEITGSAGHFSKFMQP